MALSERDKAILDLERTWWSHPGSKEQLVKDAVGLSTTRYREVLAELTDSEDALAYDPLVVRRLRRLRDRRRRERFEGRAAPTGDRRGR